MSAVPHICENGKAVIVGHLRECDECRTAVKNMIEGFPLLKMIVSKESLDLFLQFLEEAKNEPVTKAR